MIVNLYGSVEGKRHNSGMLAMSGVLPQQQKDYNQAVSQVRTPVEWVFGDIANYFAFLDFKKTLKINLSAVEKMYSVCALLTNAHTCLYQSMISSYFGIEPVLLDDYFT